MIHVICDFCGRDTGINAMVVSLTPIANWMRDYTITAPFGYVDKTKSYVVCSHCREKHGLPNPFVNYSQTDLKYEESLDSETVDLEEEERRLT